MKIHLLGINHFDPICLEYLIHYLMFLQDKYKDTSNPLPSFVGVEWSQRLFQLVYLQREGFKQTLRQEWTDISSSNEILLTRTLGYEADAHLDVFPNSPVLWLDKNRELVDFYESVTNFAKSRINTYESFLRYYTYSAKDETMLYAISREAWNRSNPQATTYDRDFIWAEHTLTELDFTNGAWAIAIVGAGHVFPYPESYRSLLVEKGFECESVVLQPKIST